jgi:RNA polymerase sigma-70 factor, ECF subfamily
MTYSDAERLVTGCEATASTLEMDEDAFRAFYDRTARILWAYLARMSGDPHAADDLLQETYYRFIRSGARLENDAHRRHYLFRIATNLVRDGHRRSKVTPEPLDDDTTTLACGHDEAGRAERRHGVRAALARLKPRERALLWLAYAEGSSHREIAETLGVQTSGVRVLLFRARRRLAALLGATAPKAEEEGRHGR